MRNIHLAVGLTVVVVLRIVFQFAAFNIDFIFDFIAGCLIGFILVVSPPH